MRATLLTLAITVAASTGVVSPVHAQTTVPSQDTEDTHRALEWTTAGSMLLTATLGTVLAINKPTLFSDGECTDGNPVLGDYGCNGLTVLHGISAVISLVLYTATTTLEIDQFGWPDEGHGDGYAVANWIHLIGMGALPIVGLISVVPQVLGIDVRDDDLFKRVLRTLHLVVGYTTVGTYVATAAIDLD